MDCGVWMGWMEASLHGERERENENQGGQVWEAKGEPKWGQT